MKNRNAVLLLLAAAALGVNAREVPVATAEDSLASQATIRRDSYGVPHILARTEEAAAFAMGYAQAEDHCVEIARRFVGARGEEAKHLGTGIENDFRMKRYGNYEVARKSFGLLGPLFQRMMTAYAAGLNLYVEQNRPRLPAWIPAFDGVDVLARGRAEVMRFAFREATIREVQSRYPVSENAGGLRTAPGSAGAYGDPVEEEIGYGREEGGVWGSNMWALSGSRTASGNPILLGNPHQAWAALYWEAHITVPGRINFFGGTFVGRPLLTTGFNEHLGWTHTVNQVDLDDIFVLALDPARENQYVFDGKPMPLTSKEIAVTVKEKDGSLREERRTYWYSHLGPIVHRTKDRAFAIKSAILDAFRYYEQWYAMSKARSLKEFLEALRMNSIPMFNLCYADAEGNILYVWNGTLPKRVVDGTDYRVEVPGDTGRYVWSRFHTLNELPQLLNPSGGYVQNCNDPPWWTSLRNLLDPSKYPPYIEPGRGLGLRTQISLQMLEGQERFSLEDVKRLKFQTRMLLADRVKPALLDAGRRRETKSEELAAGLSVLDSWDNRTAQESRGAVLFQRFWVTYQKAASRPFDRPWDSRNPASTPSGIGDPQLALRHLEEAVRWTRKTYGTEKVAWGEVHRIRLGSLDLPGSGGSGEYGLFRVMGYAEASDGKRVAGFLDGERPLAGGGDGWITAVEFGKPLTAYSILAYGQTSNPASRHSSDQARLFAEHQFKRAWFTEEEIQANLERSYRPGANGKHSPGRR